MHSVENYKFIGYGLESELLNLKYLSLMHFLYILMCLCLNF